MSNSRAGIVIVHQELNMLGHLTVAQNLFIGREFKKGITIPSLTLYRANNSHDPSIYQGCGCSCFCIDMYYF